MNYLINLDSATTAPVGKYDYRPTTTRLTQAVEPLHRAAAAVRQSPLDLAALDFLQAELNSSLNEVGKALEIQDVRLAKRKELSAWTDEALIAAKDMAAAVDRTMALWAEAAKAEATQRALYGASSDESKMLVLKTLNTYELARDDYKTLRDATKRAIAARNAEETAAIPFRSALATLHEQNKIAVNLSGDAILKMRVDALSKRIKNNEIPWGMLIGLGIAVVGVTGLGYMVTLVRGKK